VLIVSPGDDGRPDRGGGDAGENPESHFAPFRPVNQAYSACFAASGGAGFAIRGRTGTGFEKGY